jgi:hypothetical protein
MASGDPVVQVLRELPPGTAYATDDIRPGGSTPAEAVHVIDFDASATEYRDFLCQLVGYDGGGLTFTLPYAMSSATSGGVRWEIAIRRLTDDAVDIDSSHTYDFNGVTDTVASASGELSYPTVSFTNGSDMDSWAEGEAAVVRIRRKHDDAGDTASGDAELLGFIGKET